ncbi:acyltransferase [Streptococcus sp. 27098_8_73]|uniref:acyltransferase family protein n=1 Tax=Streptococcus sp. 27098_8_73 TaxID=3003668 RepID=UPI00352C5CF5
MNAYSQQNPKRIEWIDFGKGLTVLMVVFGHVVLGLFESKRFEDSNQWLLFVTQVFYLFHIPVFYALSGFFFKPVADLKSYVKFVKQKTIILGIPYLFYSIVQFILQKIGGATVRNAASFWDLVNIYQTPLGVSWYLYVLWWIYLVVAFLSIWIKSYRHLFIISIVAYFISIFTPVNIYVVQKIFLWTFFFLLGSWIRHSGVGTFLTNRWKSISCVTLVAITVFLTYWQLSAPTFYISYDRPGLNGLIFPVSVILAMASYPILNTVKGFGEYFRKIGKDSLVIYLLHAPIVSVTRITLLKLGVGNVFLHVILGLLMGWFGSIIILYVAKKIPYGDFVFYPMKYLKKQK